MERYSSIRSILALAIVMKWKTHPMDIKTTFLNGVVEEELYVEQPLGVETPDRKTCVCKSKKALYGFKQESRTWYKMMGSFLMSLGFIKSKVDSNI